ncbi:histidine--tRNA ligase [Gammaproteobacteria bacterium]|nr:histidine--tRNA ligase [Gammaproteobacteria bacterium]MDA9561224.1 histidine--tRNA ligase [Gammaproteobacteria bacterium]MDA9867545.1 histidine--tRNA ligase [Gammaproteobacteria bacterium]MDC3225470.1 histidine--tRNA ligase [Gammaproteobacteria bacterium]
MDNIKSLTGMQDHFNDGDKDNLSSKFFQVEQKIKEIFINYKLEEIRTPALEDANLFNRSVGNSSDIVNKEIYAFNDRNNKTIALRPEGTASVIRSIIEKKLDQTTHKLWYMGPMWRYERPQKGRYRQFNQAGVEILGIKEGFPEFEMISLVCSIINGFNLKNCSIKINHLGTKENKQTFCDALVQYLLPFKDSLDDKDVERLNKNPLRILDTKSEKTQALLKNAPSIKDYIDQTSIEFLKSIKDQFSDLCDIEIDYSLVRGLDYYSGFVFEAISSELGAQDSFLGGGRYDHLCKKLGGKDLPSIGMALGIERFAELINTDTSSTKTASFLIVTSNLEPKAYKIAHQLRALNKEIILDVHLSDGSLKSKLRRSNKDNADYAIIIGEDELKNNTAVIKYLKDELREQQTVTLDELYSFYKSI